VINLSKPGPLQDGSVIAVVGAGPSGCFFTLQAQREAEARGIRIRPLLFDGKSFLHEGPRGCNMCAGVISGNLAREIEDLGLKLPRDRVQRLIRSYVFHTKEGSHSVISPPGRGPIPVVFRGNGPRFSEETRKISFDDFLLEKALERGAEIIRSHVTSLSLEPDPNKRPGVHWKDGSIEVDLIVVACGVSSSFGRQLADSGVGYVPPRCVHAFQAELDLGDAALGKYLGDSIHVFSLGIRGIRFAALTPKSRFVTVSLVGDRDLSRDHLEAFLRTPTVRQLLPPGWRLPERYCYCRPRLPVRGARRFFGNRLVFVGDASITRYYKNGIDSAFGTARYAVQAAFDHGLSSQTLRKSFSLFVKREFRRENAYARIVFGLNDFVAARRFWVRAHLYFVRERPRGRTAQTLHYLTWTLFTGDARYKDIFWTGLRPRFLFGMILRGLRYRLGAHPEPVQTLSPLQPALLYQNPSPMGPLHSGQTIAIVGGGPGGTSCGIALKAIAEERGIDIRVVLYEQRIAEEEGDFNPCAGVLSPPISEILEQKLALSFPSSIVERTIRSYRLFGARKELELASGSHRSFAVRRRSWDEFMLEEAKRRGVEVVGCKVTGLEAVPDGVTVHGGQAPLRADVVVGAFGTNLGTASLFERWTRYRKPRAMETIVTEVPSDETWMSRFGEEIIAFLPNIPDVSFGAITPKRNHLTINIAGPRVDASHMEAFLELPQVHPWLPPDYDSRTVAGRCRKGLFPNGPAKVFFADRFVAVGDAAGLVRPFKGKGITAACMSGLSAARVMMDYGISRKAFHAYELACRPVLSDRHYGWFMQKIADCFRLTDTVDVLLSLAQNDPGLRRALFYSVSGDEPYRKIFREGFQVSRIGRLLREAFRQKVLSVK
jgi:flavin-dependent dehydrogenase